MYHLFCWLTVMWNKLLLTNGGCSVRSPLASNSNVWITFIAFMQTTGHCTATRRPRYLWFQSFALLHYFYWFWVGGRVSFGVGHQTKTS